MVVKEGNELTPRQVKDVPTVSWDASPDCFYTLAMTGIVLKLDLFHYICDPYSNPICVFFISDAFCSFYVLREQTVNYKNIFL